jgi:hypothetical protein
MQIQSTLTVIKYNSNYHLYSHLLREEDAIIYAHYTLPKNKQQIFQFTTEPQSPLSHTELRSVIITDGTFVSSLRNLVTESRTLFVFKSSVNFIVLIKYIFKRMFM